MHLSAIKAIGMRLPLLALGGISLLAGMWGGLLRLDWLLPVPQADWISLHGPLMVCGFLGTLIGLERAVGLRRRWAYLGPIATGLGAALMIAGVKGPSAPYLMIVGGLSLCAVFAYVFVRQPSWFAVTLWLGALCWLIGDIFWADRRDIPQFVLWWGAFLVLTIAGERLELTRLLPLKRNARVAFLLSVALFFIGLGLMQWRLIGVSLVLLAAWLIRFDIARRTVHQKDLTRFTATCLLAGYGWLAVSGLLAAWFGLQSYGVYYDAILHSLFLGFVFSMIFGHAPIILPAVLRVSVPYHRILYIPLALLHLSLALRVASDLASWGGGRMWGGALNVTAVLSFLVAVVLAAVAVRRQSKARAEHVSAQANPVRWTT
jgi:hypothetical protein